MFYKNIFIKKYDKTRNLILFAFAKMLHLCNIKCCLCVFGV